MEELAQLVVIGFMLFLPVLTVCGLIGMILSRASSRKRKHFR
jgi:hypothetical protein